MPKRPKLFPLLAFIFIGIAVSMPIQVIYLYDLMPWQLFAIFNKITYLNFCVALLSLGNAYLLFRASPLLKFTIPLQIAVLAWNNFVVGYSAMHFSPQLALLSTLVFVLLCTPLLQPDIRFIMAHADRRWWLRPARYKSEVPITINPWVGKSMKANSFDISESGTFLSLKDILLDGKTLDAGVEGESTLKDGDNLKLTIHISTAHRILCDAKVVRTTEAKGEYPAGIGIRFTSLKIKDKLYLKKHINNIDV